jgi:hypothetical protein
MFPGASSGSRPIDGGGVEVERKGPEPMAKKTESAAALPEVWREAGRRHRLSERHLRMARELGLNPKKLGSLDNHRQEPWKLPLRQFIEELYAKRFGTSP